MDFTRLYSWALTSMWILVGFPLFAGLVLATIIAIKWARHAAEAKRLQEEADKAKLDDQGRPWPPHTHGLCEFCKQAFDEVFFLPDDTAVCRKCYYERQIPHDGHE